jgi:hypothetical protein
MDGGRTHLALGVLGASISFAAMLTAFVAFLIGRASDAATDPR